MLKIVTRQAARGGMLLLEGRLIGPWVGELERVSEGMLASGVALTVDLAELAFADREGIALLRRLRDREVALANVSPFLTERLNAHVPASSTPGADDDEGLVQGLRRGDRAAIEMLVTRFSDRAFRVAKGITKSAADAEEVVQDVFATIVQKIETFQGRAALSTWIYRVTTNAALNKRRGKRRELEVPLEADLPGWKADGHREGERAFLLADWSGRPDEVLLSKEGRALLEAALARLPDDYRAVVVLRDVEELSSEEAAAALGDSVAAVKSRLHRARMMLREQLTRALAEPGDGLDSRRARDGSSTP
jgi:RNA polymerase sigma-70 factor (ECF subfamily)